MVFYAIHRPEFLMEMGPLAALGDKYNICLCAEIKEGFEIIAL
jgi:hypothetical protein